MTFLAAFIAICWFSAAVAAAADAWDRWRSR